MAPQFTNRLATETSPYLLQHAHNPVDWYPWGEEAFEKARIEDKPVLVSIGYSACHWCHVMERESFEDPSTAEIMNASFVNIKIDREERPDLDHIYMDALQALSGSGGWPLNIFLTPDAKPFYGGTYFPPVRLYQRASWKETLDQVQQAWHQKKHEVIAQAENLTEHLRLSNSFGSNLSQEESLFSKETLQKIADAILTQADTSWGGLGKAPKFPQTFVLLFLLRHYHFTGDPSALRHVQLSLNKMMQGGIYDQLGGGFARYATDAEWFAPHFEKMLYDNALLIVVYAEAYQLTQNEAYLQVVKETVSFVREELLSPEKGFYTALDADSEGIEGKFYTWSATEMDKLLGNEANSIKSFYGVSTEGNWETTNILWIPKSIPEFCAEQGKSVVEFRDQLLRSKKILKEARAQRVRPQLDDKIILGWNALMNKACTHAYLVTHDETYIELAIENMEFLLRTFRDPQQGWLRVYKKGTRNAALLEDLTFLAEALICLYEVTENSKWLQEAENLTNLIWESFSDTESPFFFYTPQGLGDVIVRKKEVYDGALPSSNALLSKLLNRLSIWLGSAEWALRSRQMVVGLGQAIVRYPASFSNWACQLQEFFYGTNEIHINGEDYKSLKTKLLNNYIPYKLIRPKNFFRGQLPTSEGGDSSNTSTLWLCKHSACYPPVDTLSELMSLINKFEHQI